MTDDEPLNSSGSGLHFGGEDESSAMVGETDLLVGDSESNNFKPIKTIPILSFHLLVSTIISITGIILAIVWTDKQRCEAYFIMVYLRVTFWIITFFVEYTIRHHHEKLRINGYHEFHKSTLLHNTATLYIVSLWNTAILGIQTLMHHYYADDFGERCVQSIFSPIIYISSFSSLETLILFAVHGTYIARVMSFNTAAPMPDALIGSHTLGVSVGQIESSGYLSELLEKQADLIDCLKDHNLKLSQKLMQMNAQVRTVPLH